MPTVNGTLRGKYIAGNYLLTYDATPLLPLCVGCVTLWFNFGLFCDFCFFLFYLLL